MVPEQRRQKTQASRSQTRDGCTRRARALGTNKGIVEVQHMSEHTVAAQQAEAQARRQLVVAEGDGRGRPQVDGSAAPRKAIRCSPSKVKQ